ncbi:hypothetical protein CRUP_028438, partial [Coryphaenoides rupestris]
EVSYVLKGTLDRVRQDQQPTGRMTKVNYSPLTKIVEISGDKGPLGIHVVPYNSSLSGRSLGLHIKGIEENSRSRRDRLFQEDESQEVFRQVLGSPLVRLEVLPVSNKPRYEKGLISQLFTGEVLPSPSPAGQSPLLLRPATTAGNPASVSSSSSSSSSSLPANQPTRSPRPPSAESFPSVSPSPPAGAATPPLPTVGPRSQSPPQPAAKGPTGASLAGLATRKAGKRLKIELKKGTEGLGFTVVTRDSALHGPGPILVKNILPRGAAIQDGRLQPGDRILEVNGVDMTERPQEELKGEDSPLPGPQVQEDGREQLMLEVPLNDTGSAGLGVSLKGNRSRETGEDLGIFIKSIIHGGAAHKDGRLRVNDQLLEVNGESLQGHSNHAAMETLRRSMSSEGNARGTIQLVLQRCTAQAATGQSGGSTNTSAAANGYQDGNVYAANQVQPEPQTPQAHRRRAGETHTRYAYDRGQGQRPAPSHAHSRHDSPPRGGPDAGYPRHSRASANLPRHAAGNPNGDTHAHTHARAPDNEDRRLGACGGGGTVGHAPSNVHARSTPTQSYASNIRAMADQMYGEPPALSRHGNRNARRYEDVPSGYEDAHIYRGTPGCDSDRHENK